MSKPQHVIDAKAARQAENDAVDLQVAKNKQIEEIERMYSHSCCCGDAISINGIEMKCSFDDATVVRHTAEYLQRQGVPTMTLKDVHGDLHVDIAIADALTAADDMGGIALANWTNRENKKKEIKDATTIEEVEAITWE